MLLEKDTMLVNTDINILGGLPDLDLIPYFLFQIQSSGRGNEESHTYTAIKTSKSVKRFEKAITGTLLRFSNHETEHLIRSILSAEAISPDSMLMLFWNASVNNDLLQYLNKHVYFPAFFSGKLTITKDDVSACIKELKETDITVQEWTPVTIATVARKYLTLLKKFNLMEGVKSKRILHPYLNDKMFVLFVYWLVATEKNRNILESNWLNYSFSDRAVFIERIMQKKLSSYFELTYTGDKLKIETLMPYDNIYNAIK